MQRGICQVGERQRRQRAGQLVGVEEQRGERGRVAAALLPGCRQRARQLVCRQVHLRAGAVWEVQKKRGRVGWDQRERRGEAGTCRAPRLDGSPPCRVLTVTSEGNCASEAEIGPASPWPVRFRLQTA